MLLYQKETVIETTIEIVGDQIALAKGIRREAMIEKRMQKAKIGKVAREKGRTEKAKKGKRIPKIRTKKKKRRADAADPVVLLEERQTIGREEIESEVGSGTKGALEIGNTKGKETVREIGKGMIEIVIGAEGTEGGREVAAEVPRSVDLREKRNAKKGLRKRRKIKKKA